MCIRFIYRNGCGHTSERWVYVHKDPKTGSDLKYDCASFVPIKERRPAGKCHACSLETHAAEILGKTPADVAADDGFSSRQDGESSKRKGTLAESNPDGQDARSEESQGYQGGPIQAMQDLNASKADRKNENAAGEAAVPSRDSQVRKGNWRLDDYIRNLDAEARRCKANASRAQDRDAGN